MHLFPHFLIIALETRYESLFAELGHTGIRQEPEQQTQIWLSNIDPGGGDDCVISETYPPNASGDKWDGKCSTASAIVSRFPMSGF